MSRYERYEQVDISPDYLLFEFVSEGPKGTIRKRIQFTPMEQPGVFNLAFGDVGEDGTIDDLSVNDNKDRNKILATVADVVFDFTKRFPHHSIYFTGSTDERTRLYRMAISLNYQALSQDFYIWGLQPKEGLEPFIAGRNYAGFLIRRKGMR